MLNENEKQLLAVSKYFNTEKQSGRVAKLIKKLADNFDFETVNAMTGFGLIEIDNLIASVPVRKQTKQVQKLLDDSKKAIAELDAEEKAEAFGDKVHFDEPESEPAKPDGQPIELTSDSLLYERVAHEIAKAITDELNSGDPVWKQREIVQRFECTASTASNAMKVLREKGWIEPIMPDNIRSPYKVA